MGVFFTLDNKTLRNNDIYNIQKTIIHIKRFIINTSIPITNGLGFYIEVVHSDIYSYLNHIEKLNRDTAEHKLLSRYINNHNEISVTIKDFLTLNNRLSNNINKYLLELLLELERLVEYYINTQFNKQYTVTSSNSTRLHLYIINVVNIYRDIYINLNKRRH